MAVKFNFKGLDEPFEADWPVSVQVPQDGGSVEEQTFMARLRLLSEEDLDLVRRGGPDGNDPNAFTKAFWVGFGASEQEAFTPELRDLMLGRPYVRLALHQAYGAFSQGIVTKN
jgi:hypothetical protein